MVNGAEAMLLEFLPVQTQELWQLGGGRMGKPDDDGGILKGGMDVPDSKLCGLPADLPRNLASFSPRVDDGDGGGAWPGRLGHHLWFLSDRRRDFRVMTVGFRNCRGETWGRGGIILLTCIITATDNTRS